MPLWMSKGKLGRIKKRVRVWKWGFIPWGWREVEVDGISWSEPERVMPSPEVARQYRETYGVDEAIARSMGVPRHLLGRRSDSINSTRWTGAAR